jgi:hypothetical protein
MTFCQNQSADRSSLAREPAWRRRMPPFVSLPPRCPPIHFACGTSGWANGRPPLSQGLASKGRLNWDQKIPLLDGNSLDRYIVHCAENGYRKVRMLGFGERRGLPVRTANLLSNPAKAFRCSSMISCRRVSPIGEAQGRTRYERRGAVWTSWSGCGAWASGSTRRSSARMT